MNANIEFRFKTRTRSVNGDYRVYGDGGREIYDESKFKPIAAKADLRDEPCAVLYEENKKIYVAAFGLQRGEKDFSNRPKVFSFCQIFDNNKWNEAWTAFKRVILDWPEVEKKMQSLIKEMPKPETRSETIEFKQDDFMQWLQSDNNLDLKIKFNELKADETAELEDLRDGLKFKPKGGCVLKWDLDGEEIYCIRPFREGGEGALDKNGGRKGIGGRLAKRGRPDGELGQEDEQGGKKSKGIWKFAAAASIILIVAGAYILFMPKDLSQAWAKELKEDENKLESYREDLNQAVDAAINVRKNKRDTLQSEYDNAKFKRDKKDATWKAKKKAFDAAQDKRLEEIDRLEYEIDYWDKRRLVIINKAMVQVYNIITDKQSKIDGKRNIYEAEVKAARSEIKLRLENINKAIEKLKDDLKNNIMPADSKLEQ